MNLEKFIERTTPLGILGIIITQHNETVAEYLWDDTCRRNVYSASKSFTATAVGMAIEEGLLSLDERLVDVFADELPNHVSDYLKQATVKDLLTMCLGQERAELMGAQRPDYVEEDWVSLSLAFPFVDAPGTKFVYNNVGPYLAGILVQRRAGCDLVSYLMPRLFMPLGIKRPTWEMDPLGNTFGAGGLYLNIYELHKFGLLYLNDGVWDGKRLISHEWVEESTKKQVDNDCDEFGYGYLFWRGPHDSYRADGKYCQWSIILKEKNAVITIVAECRNGRELSEALWEEIYPQL